MRQRGKYDVPCMEYETSLRGELDGCQKLQVKAACLKFTPSCCNGTKWGDDESANLKEMADALIASEVA